MLRVLTTPNLRCLTVRFGGYIYTYRAYKVTCLSL
jgi:hypothetical protein